MKTALIKSLVSIALFATAFATPGVAQKPTPTAASAPGRTAPMEQVDLGESARFTGEVSRFLQHPKLGEAIALAKSDKMACDEALRSPREFLAKHGVMVPQNLQVAFQPTGGQAPGLKVRITIEIRCCPLSGKLIISW